MSVTIGEVQVETSPAAENATPQGAQPATKRPDPDEIRLIIRRDDDRAQRLWVD